MRRWRLEPYHACSRKSTAEDSSCCRGWAMNDDRGFLFCMPRCGTGTGKPAMVAAAVCGMQMREMPRTASSVCHVVAATPKARALFESSGVGNGQQKISCVLPPEQKAATNQPKSFTARRSQIRPSFTQPNTRVNFSAFGVPFGERRKQLGDICLVAFRVVHSVECTILPPCNLSRHYILDEATAANGVVARSYQYPTPTLTRALGSST